MRDAERFSGAGTVRWLTASRIAREDVVSPRLLNAELYLARGIRRGHSYPRQRNYHGFYFFSQTQTHVWHESLLEADMLRLLDHSQEIVAIATQPMRLSFADGGEHVPDFIALHGNDRQVMYDVKALKYVNDKAREQFAKTEALCAQAGFGYEVLTGLPTLHMANLRWLSCFSHPLFHPDSTVTGQLLATLSTPQSVRAAAAVLGRGDLARGRSALYHLAWLRVVQFDIAARLGDHTLVERGPRGNA